MLHSVAVKNALLQVLSILIRVFLPSRKISCGSYIFHHIIELTFFHTFHYYYHLKIGQNAIRLLLCIKGTGHYVNPLKPELNPIGYLLALLAHHFLHVSRIRVKLLTFRLLMSYIYIWSTHS